MTQFLRFSLGYFAFAIVITFSIRERALQTFSEVGRVLRDLTPLLLFWVFTLVCLGLLINAVFQNKAPRDTIADALFATAATLLFQAGFILVKTTLPFVIPFYADSAFAELDKLLHMGLDPWILTHRFHDVLPVEWLAGIYMYGWLIPAILLPVILATLDSDPKRVRRILLVYLSAWIVVGNILALAGMSAGPIFFERLHGSDHFSGLTASMLPAGPNLQKISNAQDFLWIAYEQMDQTKGPGISAFPSVHVSIATLAAIYLYERSRFLLPLALTGVAAILFMSVYTGYHYAVDGYVSIAVVIGVWIFLRRRDLKSTECA
ncbi:phosphatase PAP2 family protein [Aliiroseovarius sp. S1339]|uniref:phosphatase PAP2 family protein n=1 Tax=Aliiroseovarius sp. S1339 TaxID=2936990 RepID=UPI0020BF1E4F|nr:phosphatase PAP2 family protein [Aliiroseovarius sp. S1339]MCK8465328.1 phosphatase PAP2 family protein [Aliiroseovarius sp. S1339]